MKRRQVGGAGLGKDRGVEAKRSAAQRRFRVRFVRAQADHYAHRTNRRRAEESQSRSRVVGSRPTFMRKIVSFVVRQADTRSSPPSRDRLRPRLYDPLHPNCPRHEAWRQCARHLVKFDQLSALARRPLAPHKSRTRLALTPLPASARVCRPMTRMSP